MHLFDGREDHAATDPTTMALCLHVFLYLDLPKGEWPAGLWLNSWKLPEGIHKLCLMKPLRALVRGYGIASSQLMSVVVLFCFVSSCHVISCSLICVIVVGSVDWLLLLSWWCHVMCDWHHHVWHLCWLSWWLVVYFADQSGSSLVLRHCSFIGGCSLPWEQWGPSWLHK